MRSIRHFERHQRARHIPVTYRPLALTRRELRHERSIDAALRDLITQDSRDRQLAAWKAMTNLISQRSEHAVDVLEANRNLRRPS